MIEVLRRNPVIAALALLCGLLLLVLGAELAMPGPERAPLSGAKVAAAEAKLLPPVAAQRAESAYPESTARPLWIPTRRPAPTPTVAAASFTRGQFVLMGVTIAGNTRIAMLREKTSGRIHRVEQGGVVNGLQVSEVHPEKVMLVQGGEREVLDLLVQKPSAGPGAAPTTVQASPGAAGPFGSSTPPAGALPAAAAAPTKPPGAVPHAAPNPSAQAVPQTQSAAPMTPEELLARRRLRRNQSP